MGPKITQETFNKAVEENINDLGMDRKEAIEEALQQFKIQGADLSNISTDLGSSSDRTGTIMNIIREMKSLKGEPEALIETLKRLKAVCDGDLNSRVTASNNGAYTVLLELAELHIQAETVLPEVLKCLIALSTKNPDILDEAGMSLMLDLLQQDVFWTRRFTLRWIKECCLMHEVNRQNLVDKNIVDVLKPLLETNNPDLQREVMGVLRALCLDDDIRVEFGRAHEHARIIASETLCVLTGLMGRGQADDKLISELILTISALMVRSEFCKKVEVAGGLELIKRVLSEYNKNEKINRQCLKLIKALAGDDEVKSAIIQTAKLGPHIINAMNTHKNSHLAIIAGLSAIAALALRSPTNSNALFDANAPEIIVSAMKMYLDNKDVQRAASWAIRNMVSRSNFQSSTFLNLGVEDILEADLSKFKEYEYDFKAALRDLGCKVKLNEEWTGKGGALTNRLKPNME